MWKPNQTGSNTPSTPEPVRPSTPTTSFEASPTRPATVGAGTAASAVPTGEQATIGKSLIVKGELTGSESLYIDGKVEGAINLPGNRVTVGRNGQVAANIVAREIVRFACPQTEVFGQRKNETKQPCHSKDIGGRL